MENGGVLSSRTQERRAALKVLVVGAEDGRRSEIKRALTAVTDPQLEVLEVTPRGSSNGNGNGGSPAVVEMVVFGTDNHDDALYYLHAKAAHSPRPVLVALLPERGPSLMRRALRAGADEVLFLPLDPEDATRTLLKISESRQREERQAGGFVVSLVSTVGGVGVTTLAGNLALAAAHSMQKRVGLVDLALQEGGLSVFLNVEPARSIMNLAGQEAKLDSIQLESALTKHESGAYLLAAPKRIEDSELVQESTVSAVLTLMRQVFDCVVVDCGNHINATKVAAWEHSDRLLYLVDQSVVSARCAWRFVELFGRLGITAVQPSFVLSRFSPQHPITEQQLTNTLARPLYAKIPRDDKALEKAQVRGQDLWQVAPNSALAKATEEMMARLAGPRAAVEEGQTGGLGILSRLRGAFSAHA
jgi:pilus assembly protein CpaE